MRDYLATYLKQTPAQPQPAPSGVILGNVHPDQLTKLTEPVSTCRERGSVSFVSSLPHTYPENQSAKKGVKAERRPARISVKASPYQLTQLTQPASRTVRRIAKHPQRKVWRRAPLWQACLDATRQPSGANDLESAALLYVALALREGHSLDETREMLHRVTPRASTHREYCADIVSRVSVNPASQVTAELAERYAAVHPFAWELGLK